MATKSVAEQIVDAAIRKGNKKKKHKGAGTKKYGRNLKKCQRYRLEGRREKNKARRAAKRERKLRKG